MIFLTILVSVFLQANANDCEALFQPPASDPVGAAAQTTYDVAVMGANGALTAATNTMNSMADNAILDAAKGITAATAGLKLMSTFAGPLAGIGLGFLTSAIFGDPNEKRLENIEKTQQCMVTEINTMKEEIGTNARNIEVNRASIATNTGAIADLNRAMTDFKSDMSRILSSDQANKIDEQDKHLEYLITDLLECLKTSSVITMEEELARLLEATDSGYARRNLAASLHWVQGRSQCDYGNTRASLWRGLTLAMDQIKPMFTHLEQLVGTPGQNNCYMSNGNTLLTIVSVTSKLQSAITLFLLNVKMKGLLTLKSRKYLYFNAIPTILDQAIAAFTSVNTKVQEIQRLAVESKFTETSGRLNWVFPCDGATWQRNGVSWYDCKKSCWASTTCTGIVFEQNSCYHYLKPTSFAEEDRRCAWQRTTRVAGKNNYQLTPDTCRALAAGANAFSGMLKSLQATKTLVDGVKTEYDNYFVFGTRQTTHFEADGETKHWESLKTCPAPSCGQQYTAVQSRLPNQNYNPQKLIGCKKGANKACPIPVWHQPWSGNTFSNSYGGYGGQSGGGHYWTESRLSKALSKLKMVLEAEEQDE